jgi:hypothetical protein
MKLEIKKKNKPKKKKTNLYELVINYMEGDADGNQRTKIQVGEDDYKNEDVQRIFHELINTVECCNNAYPNGRGGYDEYDSVPGYSKFFREEVEEDELFDDEIGNLEEAEYEIAYKPLFEQYTKDRALIGKYFGTDWNGFVDHPSDSNYISTSFDGWDLVYYDSNGDQFPVNVKFTDEEKSLHKKCKEIR